MLPGLHSALFFHASCSTVAPLRFFLKKFICTRKNYADLVKVLRACYPENTFLDLRNSSSHYGIPKLFYHTFTCSSAVSGYQGFFYYSRFSSYRRHPLSSFYSCWFFSSNSANIFHLRITSITCETSLSPFSSALLKQLSQLHCPASLRRLCITMASVVILMVRPVSNVLLLPC